MKGSTLIFTTSLFLYAQWAIVFHTIPLWFPSSSSTMTTTYTLILFLAITSYGQSASSNPGWTPKKLQLGKFPLCDRCKQPKPPRSHHCKECNMCVHKMDHHCRLIENCVGGGNQKYFCLMLFYTTILCVYTFVVSFTSVIWQLQLGVQTFLAFAVPVFSAFLALVFFFFVGALLIDQIENILNNQTLIEGLQRVKGEKMLKENLKQTLGDPINWFNPMVAPPAQDFLEPVSPRLIFN